MKTDVVVIGAGIVGTAAAYFLARRGLRVTVIERRPGAGMEASGCNGGGVRQHGRKAMLPMAMASVRMWPHLAAELGCDLEYRQTGNINIAIDPETLHVLEQEVTWEHEHGLKDVRMLTSKECQALVPGIIDSIVGGKLCTSDGVANPMLAAPAFARAAKKLGVQFQFQSEVKSLITQAGKVQGVLSDQGEVCAPVVLNTAGAWAARFSEQAGCAMPIYPGRSQMMITERIPHNPVELWVSVRGQGYMRPTVSGNLVLGTGGMRNDNYARHIDYNTISVQADRWGRLFSWLQDVAIIRICCGITEYTPDGSPYIGPVPGVDGLFVAAAFHGEGFCTGPMTGKTLADLVTGIEPSVSLEPFRPDRFSAALQAGEPIPQIVFPLEKMFLKPIPPGQPVPKT